MKIFLYYNSFAGGKKAGLVRDSVVNLLEKGGNILTIRDTAQDNITSEEISNINLSSFDAFVIAGGDGTILQALNGYLQNKSEQKPPVGFIPTGTGNAFVRDIGLLTGEIEKAVEKINSGKIIPVDAAFAETKNSQFYFFNILGIGFVADVVATGQKFKFLGNISYTIGVFIEALRLKNQYIDLLIDGQKHRFNYTFVEISNTTYTSNFYMAPNARFDDGYLDVTVLEKINLWRLLSSFPKIFKGTHLEMPEIKTFKAKEIELITQEEKLATPDGELLGLTPIRIKVIKHAMQIFS